MPLPALPRDQAGAQSREGEPNMTQEQIQELSDHALVQSLSSTTCPSCACLKKRGHTFCGREYFRLPLDMRQALYARLGRGYREAVIEALEFLGTATFITPGGSRGQRGEE